MGKYKKRPKRVHVAKHGTINEYAYYKCRCEQCKTAKKAVYIRNSSPPKRINRIAREILVYVVFNKDGEVIYVGRTHKFGNRLRTHERMKAKWLKEAVSIDLIPYPTFGDSLVAEAILIRDFKPKFNYVGVVR